MVTGNNVRIPRNAISRQIHKFNKEIEIGSKVAILYRNEYTGPLLSGKVGTVIYVNKAFSWACVQMQHYRLTVSATELVTGAAIVRTEKNGEFLDKLFEIQNKERESKDFAERKGLPFESQLGKLRVELLKSDSMFPYSQLVSLFGRENAETVISSGLLMKALFYSLVPNVDEKTLAALTKVALKKVEMGRLE